MSTEERLDYLERELTAIADYVARQQTPAPKSEQPKPKVTPKTSVGNVLLLLLFVALVVSIVGWIGLNAAVAFGLVSPPGLTQVAPTTEPLPTAAVFVRSAPVSAPRPFSAPIAAQPASVYPDTVAPYQRGAWGPGGPFALDVSGRRYRVIGQQDGATFAELDDGTRVWLGVPLVAPEAAPVVVEQPAPTSPPIGPADTWGPGGTTGGTSWGEPTALPLQNAILPAMPAIEPPTPTWGEGGSTGGATW